MLQIENYTDVLNALTSRTREFKHRVSFGYWTKPDNSERVFNAQKVVQEGIRNLKIFQPFNSSNDNILMGCACSANCQIEFYNQHKPYSFSDKVMFVECGIKTGAETYTYIPLGCYNTGKAETDDDWATVKINAYDDINSFDKKWEFEHLTFPMALKDVLTDIAGHIPIEVESFSNSTGLLLLYRSITEEDASILANYTKREVLGFLAGLMGANARMTTTGKLEVKFYKLPENNVTISGELQWQNGFKKLQDTSFTVNSISSGISDTVYTAGTGKGISFVNPIINQTDVNKIFNIRKLSEKPFTPCECEWRGNPCVEAGDIVTIVDKDNVEHTVFVANQELDLTGGLSAKITCPNGDKEISFETSKVTPMQLNKKYNDLQEAIKKATEAINGAKGGYFEILDIDEDGNPDSWIIKSNEGGTEGIIRANKEGIGLSNDGGVTYKQAITFNGIVGSSIVVGDLSALNSTIGGWNIGDKTIYSGSTTLNSNGKIISGLDSSNQAILDNGHIDFFYNNIRSYRLGQSEDNAFTLEDENNKPRYYIYPYKYWGNGDVNSDYRTVVVSSGGLVLSANGGNNGLFLEGSGVSISGKTIIYNDLDCKYNVNVDGAIICDGGIIVAGGINCNDYIEANGYNVGDYTAIQYYGGNFAVGVDSYNMDIYAKSKVNCKANFYALNVNTSSIEELKTNIKYKSSVLDLFNNSDIYSFEYKKNELTNKKNRDTINTNSINSKDISVEIEENNLENVNSFNNNICYGFVIGEGYKTPQEVLSDDGKHINLYSMASLNWKATQELLEKLEQAESKIQALEKRNEAS